MITTKNYLEKVNNVNFELLPDAIRNGHNIAVSLAQNNWIGYNENENIKRVMDAYFIKLNESLKKYQPTEKETPCKDVPKVVKKSPVTKRKNAPIPIPNVTVPQKLVEKIASDIDFIRRYASLNGRIKTKSQILSLLAGLKRAIFEKRISLKSQYGKEIELMQDELIRISETMGKDVEIKINPQNLQRYLEIGASEKNLYSIQLLKSYASLEGKENVKDKAQRLLKRMNDGVKSKRIKSDDPYKKQLNNAYVNLLEYIKGKDSTLELSKAELNGLSGILKDDAVVLDAQGRVVTMVSSVDLVKMKFETIGLQGKYRELIGDPSVGFLIMVHGLPRSGKSTLCIPFAYHLAIHHGEVLYCAVEERIGHTIQEKAERLGCSHPRLVFCDLIPANLSSKQFVFIDSKSSAGMNLKMIKELREQNPKTSFVLVYQSTKSGEFRGGQDEAHETDVIIEVKGGIAEAKSRFQSGGRMQI